MNSKTLVHSYPSLNAMMSLAVNGTSSMRNNDRYSRSANRSDWYGATWSEAVKMTAHGDIEGARRLHKDVLEAVNNAVVYLPRLDPVYKLDEGRWIDVARFVKGEPECWGDMVESEPAPRKGIAIIVNVACHAGVPANTIDKIGVVLGSSILGLQAQGYTVTLYAAQKISGYRGSDKWTHLLELAPVNPGGVPLDVAQMSIILRPWFLRRVLFSLEETFPKDVREAFDIGGGYGRPDTLTESEAQELTGQKTAIIIDIAGYVRNPKAIRDDILRQVKGA